MITKGQCDLTGMKIERWTVVGRGAKTGMWACRCECGSEKDVDGWQLKNFKSTSCGCHNVEMLKSRREDLTGKRFGRLVVLGLSDRLSDRPGGRKPHQLHWMCMCDCGKETEVYRGSLTSGTTSSCGCYRVEATTARKTKHGHNKKGKRTAEYSIWVAMRARCHTPTSPDYPEYGGRGITVCDRWRDSFEAFLEDVGPKPGRGYSIDRIKNHLGYEPGNVHWATPKQQARNTRKNRLLTFNGETMPIAAWAERIGMDQRTLGARVRAGWTDERAITTPLGYTLRSN